MATRSSRVIRYPLSAVSKSDSVRLPVGFFCDNRYAHVSAVIYSPIAGMGKIRALARDPVDQLVFKTVHPNPNSIEPRVRTTPKSDYTEHLLDGLYVIHNPNARHPLGFDTLAHERIAQLTLSEGGELLETGPTTSCRCGSCSSLAHSVDGRARLQRVRRTRPSRARLPRKSGVVIPPLANRAEVRRDSFHPDTRVRQRTGGVGGNVVIRHTRECLRRSAADIGSRARGDHYMVSRRIAPTTALLASARALTPLPLPGRFRCPPVECSACAPGPPGDCR